VDDDKAEQRVKRILRKAGVPIAGVDFFQVPTDRVWTRDYCPIFVAAPSGEIELTDWHFNGWAKYPNWQRDDAAAATIAKVLGRPIRPTLVAKRRCVLDE